MKKIYLEPEMELIKFQTAKFLAISNGDAEGGDNDGGYTPNEPDPSDPNWGDDY
jgi:hypothetical protein